MRGVILSKERSKHKRCQAGVALNECTLYFKLLSGTGAINENESISTYFQLLFFKKPSSVIVC